MAPRASSWPRQATRRPQQPIRRLQQPACRPLQLRDAGGGDGSGGDSGGDCSGGRSDTSASVAMEKVEGAVEASTEDESTSLPAAGEVAHSRTRVLGRGEIQILRGGAGPMQETALVCGGSGVILDREPTLGPEEV